MGFAEEGYMSSGNYNVYIIYSKLYLICEMKYIMFGLLSTLFSSACCWVFAYRTALRTIVAICWSGRARTNWFIGMCVHIYIFCNHYRSSASFIYICIFLIIFFLWEYVFIGVLVALLVISTRNYYHSFTRNPSIEPIVRTLLLSGSK